MYGFTTILWNYYFYSTQNWAKEVAVQSAYKVYMVI